MKYIEPKINISRFYGLIETDQTMQAVASADVTESTRSLEQMFITAAQNAEEILVYKWE